MAYDALHAPNHWLAEAVNVLWWRALKGDLTTDDAVERLATLLRAPVGGASIADLMPRAFAISVLNGVTVYDSLYIAFAERRNTSFVTADRRLIERMAGDASLISRMVWVGDLSR